MEEGVASFPGLASSVKPGNHARREGGKRRGEQNILESRTLLTLTISLPIVHLRCRVSTVSLR